MSRYKNAAQVLPPELLSEVQRHAAGTQLYIPLPAGRAAWGERSGARAALARRNAELRRLHQQGATIRELMAEFHLSYDSVRKIVNARPSGKNRLSCSRE